MPTRVRIQRTSASIRHQDRAEQPHQPLHRRRNRERNTIGRVEGRRLRQHLRRRRRPAPSSRPSHRPRRHCRTRPAARPSPSADAAILTALLPSSSAPSRRSRCSNRRLTMAARRFPCFSSRDMLARDDAVSAVSLPEKKAESSRQIKTTTSDSQSFVVIDSASLSARNARTSPASTLFSTKAWPMPRTRMNVSVPRLPFLSCAIRSINVSTAGTPPGTSFTMGRQADRRKMRGCPCGFGRRDEPLLGGEFEGQRHSQRHRLAVQQPVGKAAAGFERMPEGVAEIEQRALAGFALVARNDAGLGAAADRNGVLARRTASEDILPVLLQPGEERSVAKQTRIWQLRHSRRGIRVSAACRATPYRQRPEPADGRRRSRFLPWRELIPVLPPTEESTCASSVVGTCTKSRPRRTHEAANPARSPITPPPSATTRSLRSTRAAMIASQTFSNVA